jgi:hypothetical protein
MGNQGRGGHSTRQTYQTYQSKEAHANVYFASEGSMSTIADFGN